MRTAYDASVRLWADGPEPVYASLARALVGLVDGGLAGSRVLDLGAGTGVAGRAALAAEAAVTGTGPLVVDLMVLTAR